MFHVSLINWISSLIYVFSWMDRSRINKCFAMFREEEDQWANYSDAGRSS